MVNSGGKSPNIFAKSLAERCAKSGNGRNNRHDSTKEKSLMRKPRSSSKRDYASISDLDSDPLDLLAMMGYERTEEGAEISFADLLHSSSPTPAVTTIAAPAARSNSQKGSSHRSSSGDQKSEEGNSRTPTPAVAVSEPMAVPSVHLQPKLSYSPPSITSEESFICYDASPASAGSRIPMSHSMITAGGQGSSFLSALMVSTSISIPTATPTAPSSSSPSSPSSIYYPYLLDDPELIAAKHHSHAVYPSYIVSMMT